MANPINVIAAFSEEQTGRLTGVSKYQLRYWDRTNLYTPSYAEENRRMSFSRIYSFKDIVALRVLGVLRNQYNVPAQHLREVSDNLSHFGPDPERWTAAELYVLNRKVIWREPNTRLPQEITSKQYVVPTISLENVVRETRNDLAKRKPGRDPSKIGRIDRNKHVNHNRPVLAGTRIPVVAIQRFAEAGYSVDQIIKEYPDLTAEDVQAALNYSDNKSAA